MSCGEADFLVGLGRSSSIPLMSPFSTSFRVSVLAVTAPSRFNSILKRSFNSYSALTMKSDSHFSRTSGETDPVWIHHVPYSSYPKFPQLQENLDTDVCIVGSGISGVSAAYELVARGKQVTMIEARQILSGETGRTSGHLANALDDGYTEIAKKHGNE